MGDEPFRVALARGTMPTIVIDFAKCRDDKGQQGPPVVAAVRLSAYNLLDAYIATSGAHLFEAADGSMKLEYMRARFKPDDRANPAWMESSDTIQAGEFARLFLCGASPQQTDLL